MDPMHDLVIVLPGIGGSSLYRGDELIWDVCGGALWPLFRDRRSLNERLAVGADDGSPSHAQQIQARALISGINGIFGLGKVDGYLALRKLVTAHFDVRQGDAGSPQEDQNFFEFPYDWRKSNIESAHALKEFIACQLPAWRRWSHWENAKVILLAHSMGGLVSRYFLEVLGGWRNCRALVTFGTPFRGSMDALEYLTNGFGKIDFDLSEALRSMQSVYELLPIYPVVKADGKWQRIAKLGTLPPQLCRRRVRAALAFHRAIERKVRLHMRDREYAANRYTTYCVVGVNQPTRQSARLDGSMLLSDARLPPIVPGSMHGGDGTVPRVSATPIEQGHHFHALHFVESHSSLQTNQYVLHDLRARLQQLQVSPDAPAVRGQDDVPAPAPPAISLSVDDVYFTSEPVILCADIVPESARRSGLHARISTLDGTGVAECAFELESGSLRARVEGLPAGAYRVTVMATSKLSGVLPVHDVFEVAPDPLVRGQ